MVGQRAIRHFPGRMNKHPYDGRSGAIDDPKLIQTLNGAALRAMAWINGFAHLVLGLALAAAVLLFTWLFVDDVLNAHLAIADNAKDFQPQRVRDGLERPGGGLDLFGFANQINDGMTIHDP